MTALVVVLAGFAVAALLVLLAHRIDTERASSFGVASGSAAADVAATPNDVPASYVAARRLVVNATTARSLHFRVRPALVELTEARLRERHGIGLDAPAAAAIVGEPLWSIVRPGARPPEHEDPGMTPAAMRSLLDRLEAL